MGVKEKGKGNHCYSRVEPAPPCVKARSKMPLSLGHQTKGEMHCDLKKATVRNHVARWPCKIQVLQLPSFPCKVWIGWWEGGGGGILRQGLAVLTASWCPVSICSERRAVFLEQFSVTRNRAWNASNSSGVKHSWPFAQDSHPILPALLTQEKFQETSPTSVAKPFCAYLAWNRPSHIYLEQAWWSLGSSGW